MPQVTEVGHGGWGVGRWGGGLGRWIHFWLSHHISKACPSRWTQTGKLLLSQTKPLQSPDWPCRDGPLSLSQNKLLISSMASVCYFVSAVRRITNTLSSFSLYFPGPNLHPTQHVCTHAKKEKRNSSYCSMFSMYLLYCPPNPTFKTFSLYISF